VGKKNVNCSVGNPGSPIVRALEVLTRANQFSSESGFLVECFKLYLEEVKLMKREDGMIKWNTKKLERLEKEYPAAKKGGLKKDFGSDED